MTPLEMTIMLHHYGSTAPWDHVSRHSLAGIAALRKLVQELMLEKSLPDAGGVVTYEITDKGRAYVEALERVPLPELVTEWRT